MMNMQTYTHPTVHWKSATDTLLKPTVSIERLGLITDMDGTISHIIETPEAAVVTPRNRDILSTLVLMLPLVAVVSGRAVRDLQSRIAIPGITYIGNQGLERWVNQGRVFDEKVRKYRKVLVSALDEVRSHLTVGMWIEDKYATASVHYRLTPEPDKAAQYLLPLLSTIAEHHGLSLNPGKRFYEFRPPINTNKGTVVRELAVEFELDALLYLGDGTTDIPGFEMARQLREEETCYGLGVAVTQNGISEAGVEEHADIITHGVKDVEEFLDWLLQERGRNC